MSHRQMPKLTRALLTQQRWDALVILLTRIDSHIKRVYPHDHRLMVTALAAVLETMVDSHSKHPAEMVIHYLKQDQQLRWFQEQFTRSMSLSIASQQPSHIPIHNERYRRIRCRLFMRALRFLVEFATNCDRSLGPVVKKESVTVDRTTTTVTPVTTTATTIATTLTNAIAAGTITTSTTTTPNKPTTNNSKAWEEVAIVYLTSFV